MRKALEAGVDQFGGESRPELVVELVESGQVAEARIDLSVRRLLRQKFQLGLFENPFVDPAAVPEVFGRPASHAAGAASQRRAMTLLKNVGPILPLGAGRSCSSRTWMHRSQSGYGEVVATPEEADFAILRLQTPWYPVETKNPFARGLPSRRPGLQGDGFGGDSGSAPQRPNHRGDLPGSSCRHP